MSAAAESAANYDRLPDDVTDVFGEGATAEQAHDLLTVDVPPASWIAALETARDRLGCTYFDWLSAVDEPGTGFRVCAHVVALPAEGGPVRRLLVRTTVPHEAAVLPTAIGVYAGAAWHERETHEMFGIGFDGHPHLVPLLLPEGFEGHPLRKDFVLAARVAKAWPGAKEPGESEHGGPKRRTMLPPGVPDPNEWGPLKGQLPPAPARPARAARPAGDRPARRTRSASDATPATPSASPATPAGEPALRTAPPRRTRSASQGSASQQAPEGSAVTGGDTAPSAAPEAGPAPSRGEASGRDATREAAAASDAAPAAPASDAAPAAPASDAAPAAPVPDAPWRNARPAFDEPSGEPETLRRSKSGGPGAEPPVPEGAGRGEAPRTGTPGAPASEPTPQQAPDAPTEQTAPEGPDTSHAAETPDTPESRETPGTPGTPGTRKSGNTPEAPEPPDTPAGGDPE
ncbi:NADH-quinone oxidoreductase subunit C [Streptomyces sp. NPDC005803]|uniref:NADH-quinone oxidoreductase subunit C n=1 Tax=Streptomyces sp. NPDC005803 TaxID=3154297 RepID=UPI0033F20881